MPQVSGRVGMAEDRWDKAGDKEQSVVLIRNVLVCFGRRGQGSCCLCMGWGGLDGVA